MFIVKLSEEDVVKFIKQALKKIHKNKQIEIVKRTHSRHPNHQRLLLVVKVDRKLINYTIEFTDFYCKITDDSNPTESRMFKKAWGNFVVQVLKAQSSTPGSFSPDNYRKKYNDYWEAERDKQIQAAAKDCADNMLK